MTKRTHKKSGPALVDISAQEVRRLINPRDGFEQFLEPLLALYQKYKKELGTVPLDAKETRGRLAAFDALASDETETRKQLTAIEETRRVHAAKVWQVMLEIYARAQVASRTSSEIERAIEDFSRFMAIGKRVHVAEPATPAG